jgi:hypothetical protein
MAKALRRPGGQPSFDTTEESVKFTQEFNKKLRSVQGFRTLLAAGVGTTVLNVKLNSPGKFLFGLSIVPTLGADISDTQVNFTVNNKNLVTGVAANNLNPNFVQNMIFFPTPQPLQGNDQMFLEFTKNSGVASNIIVNIFYQGSV